MSSPMNADAQELDRLIGYLRADPSNLRLRADIFERALAGGRHDEAQRQVDWVLSRTPVDFGWRHRMAVLDMARGQPAAAAALLQSLIDEGQSDPAVAFNLAYADFLLGRHEAAIERLARLRDRQALPPQGLALQLRAMHRLGQLDAALDLFRLDQGGQTTGDAYGVASLIAVDTGELSLAQQWATQALEMNAVNQEALVSLGMAALAAQDVPRALHHLDQAVARQPEDGRSWSALGLARLLQRDLPAARDALMRATTYMPDHIGTWHTLGWCEIFRHDLPAARRAFEASIALDRNFGESHGGLAAVLALQGERADAVAALRRARRLNPVSLSAQYAQSVLDGDNADFERFVQVARTAFEAHQGPGGQPLSTLVFGAGAGPGSGAAGT